MEDSKNRKAWFRSIVLAACFVAATPWVAAQTEVMPSGAAEAHGGSWLEQLDGEYDPTRVIIGFRDAIPATPPGYIDEVGGTVVMTEPVLKFIVVSAEASETPRLMNAAEADPEVAYVEYDGILRSQFVPNDVLYISQWGPAAVKLPQAWDTTLGSHSVALHILDTGIDYAHADLTPNLSPLCQGPTALGRSTIGVSVPGGYESGFHGTHVGGIAAGVINNKLGIAGASQSCVTSVRVLAAEAGLVSWVATGIRWSADNGADIISMSLGGGAASTLNSAVKYADGKGVLQIAAAGNDGCSPSGTVGYPAAYPEVMAVAALATATTIASYSSCGSQVEISAPGSNIISTLPGNAYGFLSGTSMATPLVAGVAGLVLAVNPALTHTELRCILTETADPLGAGSPNTVYGHGRVDADEAVDSAIVLPAAC